jgi:hypothetical protein
MWIWAGRGGAVPIGFSLFFFLIGFTCGRMRVGLLAFAWCFSLWSFFFFVCLFVHLTVAGG